MLLPWKIFLDGLVAEKVFLHRREFRQQYPAMSVALPVILREANGKIGVLLTAEEIKAGGSLDGLTQNVRERLAAAASPPPAR